MASLAPGNGWFPHRTDASRRSASGPHRQPGNTVSNVYPFPGFPNALDTGRWKAASGSAVANRLATLLVAESMKSGRTAGWVLGWTAFGLVLASVMWLGLATVLIAAALLIGVPWMTVAVAATLTHALGATLAVLMGLRIGRSILQSIEKRNQAMRKDA